VGAPGADETTYRLVSFVTALLPQRILVMPDVVAVPRQEEGLLNVRWKHHGGDPAALLNHGFLEFVGCG
jgi:hypothetical protein